MKNRLSIMLVIIIASFIVLVGCNSDTVETAKENSDGKTVVTAFSSITPNIADFNDNLLTQKIEEKLDIDIEFQTTPSDGAKQKQSLLLGSGDYPTAFIGGEFTGLEQIKYGQEGILIPLNDLIEEHAPNIQAAFEKEPWLKDAITMPDGNIYALPGSTGCYHCTYPMKMWINTEWLENLNMEMPQTTEQFEEVLVAFKNDDPNGNGENDEVPLSGLSDNPQMNPINFLMSSFIYTNPANYFQIVDGELEFVANKPEWKQGLAYIQDLYSQGLIDPQAFTQKEEGLMQLANQADAKLGTFPALWSGGALTIEEDAETWKQYEATPPLKGPNGLKETVYNGKSAGAGKFAITDEASEEQQIAAIKIANYIYSEEGSLDVAYGVGGWELAGEGDIGVNGEPAIFSRIGELDWTKPTNTLWDNDFTNISDELYNGQKATQDSNTLEGYERYLYLQTKEKYEGFEPVELLDNVTVGPDNAQKAAELGTDIVSFIQQNAVQFVIGERILDSDWDKYVSELEDLGSDEYLQIYQDAYEAQK